MSDSLSINLINRLVGQCSGFSLNHSNPLLLTALEHVVVPVLIRLTIELIDLFLTDNVVIVRFLTIGVNIFVSIVHYNPVAMGSVKILGSVIEVIDLSFFNLLLDNNTSRFFYSNIVLVNKR